MEMKPSKSKDLCKICSLTKEKQNKANKQKTETETLVLNTYIFTEMKLSFFIFQKKCCVLTAPLKLLKLYGEYPQSGGFCIQKYTYHIYILYTYVTYWKYIQEVLVN